MKNVCIGNWPIQYIFLDDYIIGDILWSVFKDFENENLLEPELTISFSPNLHHDSLFGKISIASPISAFKNGLLYTRIYQNIEDGYFWILGKKTLDTIAFSVSSNWSTIELLYDLTDTKGELVFANFFDLIVCAFINFGGIVFHGVVLAYQEKGIIISAPSGTGKSTHAHLWRDAGFAEIINGDRALCRRIDSQWEVFGMPWCGSSGESENRQIPLMAIVVLEQHHENDLSCLNAVDILYHLLPNIIAPKWEMSLFNKALDRLDEIIPHVPIYLLRCRPDADAVLLLKQEMDKLLTKNGKV